MAEYTPGPWEVYDGHDGQLGHYNIDAEGAPGTPKQIVAFTVDHRKVDEANARLIAAAPAMLAALERCLLFINDRDKFEMQYGTPEFPDSSINIQAWRSRVILTPVRDAIAQARTPGPVWPKPRGASRR